MITENSIYPNSNSSTANSFRPKHKSVEISNILHAIIKKSENLFLSLKKNEETACLRNIHFMVSMQTMQILFARFLVLYRWNNLKKTQSSQMFHATKIPSPQIDANSNVFQEKRAEESKQSSQIFHAKEKQMKQSIFTNAFLEECFNLHQYPTYFKYSELQKEMEKKDHEVKNIDPETFKDECQSAFSYIRQEKKFPFSCYSNFVSLINAEYNKNIANSNSNFEEQFNSIHCGLVKKQGPWSKSETDILIQVILDMINADGKIDWIEVSRHIVGRTGKSCYDKFRSLNLISKKKVIPINFNTMLLAAFTDFEEDEMIDEILDKINHKVMVTLNDVSALAFKKYYSPLSLAIR